MSTQGIDFVHVVPSVQPEYLWLVIVGGILAFAAAWGIGANDTANSWGSTVGAKAITVRNAAILAAIFEVTGAFALGGNVGGTLKSKIVDPKYYCGDNYSLVVRMIGMIAVDLGTAIWLFIATRFGMPVSTTHSAVGGVCGFGIVTRGWGSVIWWETMGKIFISWVTSPLLACIIGYVTQFLIKFLLFRGKPGSIYKKNHLWLPVIAGVFIGVAAVFAFYIGGKSNDGVKDLDGWVFAVTFAATTVGAIIILSVAAKILRKRWNIDMDAYVGFEEKTLDSSASSSSEGELATFNPAPTPDGVARAGPIPSAASFFNNEDLQEKDIYDGLSAEVIATEQLWAPLCWIVASVESFSHGANDVGNAIGPYAALIDSYNNSCPKGTKVIPYWILGLGAAGILIGLVTYGHRVVKTLGVDIAIITPQKAAASEIATVITVLIATALAIPVSTTHCSVGGITGVSLVNGWRNINWRTIGGVGICILITVPCVALMTAAVFAFWHAAVFGASYPGPSVFNHYCNATSPGPWK